MKNTLTKTTATTTPALSDRSNTICICTKNGNLRNNCNSPNKHVRSSADTHPNPNNIYNISTPNTRGMHDADDYDNNNNKENVDPVSQSLSISSSSKKSKNTIQKDSKKAGVSTSTPTKQVSDNQAAISLSSTSASLSVLDTHHCSTAIDDNDDNTDKEAKMNDNLTPLRRKSVGSIPPFSDVSELSLLTDLTESGIYTPARNMDFDAFVDNDSIVDAEIVALLGQSSICSVKDTKEEEEEELETGICASSSGTKLRYRPTNPVHPSVKKYEFDTLTNDDFLQNLSYDDDAFLPNLSIDCEDFVAVGFGTDDPIPIHVANSTPLKVTFYDEVNLSKESLCSASPVKKRFNFRPTPRPLTNKVMPADLAQCPFGTEASPFSTSESSAFESARKMIDMCTTEMNSDKV